MISRIRAQLGPAGFVIAVVALVAALAGGAYAASGALTGKQKKEVEKISKKFAGKNGAPGAAGANGKDGAPGSAGANGKDGTNGQNGAPGTDGKSVVIGTATTCAEGGVTVEVASESSTKKSVCNGEEGPAGSPWTADGTLPSGATETGSWGLVGNGTERNVEAISFPVPLAAADAEGIEVKFWKEEAGQEDPACPGSTLEPKADPGVFCLYFSKATTLSLHPQVDTPEFGAEEEEAVGPSGALLEYRNLFPITDEAGGSFAITAP